MSRHAVRGVVADCSSLSDPGLEPSKQVNEDSSLIAETPLGLALILCDGMGGHVGGREASLLAVRSIAEHLGRAAPDAAPEPQLAEAVVTAGRAVYGLGDSPEMPARPGSTVVVGLLHERGLSVAHVGDSRLYLLREGALHRLTRDHSLVQQLLDTGQLTPEQAAVHPDTNIITRALGMVAEVDVEVRPEPVPLFPGDVVLLTSDGLTDLVTDAELQHSLRARLPEGLDATAAALVRFANERGGHDNITVQLAHVRDVQRAAAVVPPHAVSPTLVSGLAPTALDGGPAPTHVEEPVPATLLPGQDAPTPARTTQPALLQPPPHAPQHTEPELRFPSHHASIPPAPARQLVWVLAAAGLLVACILAAVLGWWLYRLQRGAP